MPRASRRQSDRCGKPENLVGNVHKFVIPGNIVYTDELNAYNTVGKERKYIHRTINHSSRVYVRGDIHTNSVEGFFSLLKKGIGGVYHSVSQKYLQTYIDEYTFRYNRRFEGNQQFNAILERVLERAS